jgi:uncharacterized membrane protein
MPIRAPSNWLKVLATAGVAYPFLVYAGLAYLPGRMLLLVGLAMVLARLLFVRGIEVLAVWSVPLGVGAAVLAVLAVVDPPWGARAYPVVMSLAACGAFAITLLHPPSLVERIARRTEPDLPPQGVRYTRRVTQVWAGFLAANAAVAAALAAWGTLAQWTLWNGLVSYLLMGALFAGEMLVRRRVRRRAGPA